MKQIENTVCSNLFPWRLPPSSGKAEIIMLRFSLYNELFLMMVMAATETCWNIVSVYKNFLNSFIMRTVRKTLI